MRTRALRWLRWMAPATGLAALALGGRAHALYIESQVKPADLSALNIGIAVKTKQVDGSTQFEVTVRGKEHRLEPVLLARVHLIQGDQEIATVPVEETRSGETISYWFRVSQPLLAASKFEFSEHGAAQMRDEKQQVIRDSYGRPEFIALPGGRGYWFYLRDFAGTH